MHRLKRLFTASAVLLSAIVFPWNRLHAAPQAVGSSYDIDQNDSDNGCHILMAEGDNILRGKTPTYIDSDHSWYNDGNFYETQTTDFGCVTDGKIPFHRNDWGYGWNDRSDCRALMPQDAKLEWTWETPEVLANVRIFTQWPDGNRTDVSVKAIEVKIGNAWTTLANSAFDFANDTNLNTVEPYQAGLKNRMVTFAEPESYLNLAANVTGLRITFDNQSGNLCYGCYWEIEAKRGQAVSFLLKNTVNGNTEYTAAGEVLIAAMKHDEECNLYQVTVEDAAPADGAWKTYTPGTLPTDVITFELSETTDWPASFDLYLKGDEKAAYKVGTAVIKSAYGAIPTAKAKANAALSAVLPNEYDSATIPDAAILALDASEDTHGGIISREVVVGAADPEHPTVSYRVTNLAGNSATVEIPVNLTPAKGPLPPELLKVMLHLGSVLATDDFAANDGGKVDYLADFGGEANQLAYAGLAYEGVATSGGCSTPGKLIWTPMKVDSGNWAESAGRDNYVKYWQLYVNSPTERDIKWHQKSDDSIWVWVNGELQSQNDYTGDYLDFPGHLRKGLNVITVKFYEQGGGENMSVALCKPGEGTAYFSDLTYQLYPGFMIRDAETGDTQTLTSDAVEVAYLPKLKGYTHYQIVQNDFVGSARPRANAWVVYTPGVAPTDPIPCTLSTDDEFAYFTLFFKTESGEIVECETMSIRTSVRRCGDLFAIGGEAATLGDGEYLFSFKQPGKLRVSSSIQADILLVGGGGGGGTLLGGGGGGGGVVYRESVTLRPGLYDVNVGLGGVGASWDGTVAAASGGNTEFAGLFAYGGGSGGGSGFTGGGFYDGSYEGGNGASGGGASGHRPLNNINDYTPGAGIEGLGFAGGASIQHNVPEGNDYGGGGGGGGAGVSGGAAYWTDGNADVRGGAGGNGAVYDITGSDVYYGGGGAGGSNSGVAAPGGTGGGGAGGFNNGSYNLAEPGADGVDGLGGGGGGGGLFFGHYGNENSQGAHGGRGGNGAVIIRFRQRFAPDSKRAEGGDIVKKIDGWMVHIFTNATGRFSIPNSVIGQVLLVGGGGGGGNGYGAAGGGGGGGMLVVEAAEIPAGNYEIIVGQGGLGGVRGREDGGNGGDSVFGEWTAVGGGGGAGIWNVNGLAGGSGGGAYSMTLMNNRGDYNGGAAVEGQGFPGGGSTLTGGNADNFGPGGGGAGEAGASSSTEGPGKGGDGRVCDFSGVEVCYAGGGAGGGNANVNRNLYALGGAGGGGNGGYWPIEGDATSDDQAAVGDGVDGLGGGGGGGAMWGNGNLQGRGGNGGSGIVIIRYKQRAAGLRILVR